MTFALVALLVAAAISLGLRSTAAHDARAPHPLDRLVVGLGAGGALVWAGLLLSSRWRVFEAGLGLLVSLAPVGLYDLARWWYLSKRPFAPWVVGSHRPAWVRLARVLAVVALALACAGAFVAIGGVLAAPSQ
jgi:hypothetical protein